MSHQRARVFTAVLLTGLAVVLTGCTTSGGTLAATPPSTASDTTISTDDTEAGSSAGQALQPALTADPAMIEQLTAFSTPDALAEEARALATHNCMTAKGFDYDLPLPLHTEPRHSISTPHLSIEQAQDPGYPRLSTTVPQSDDKDLNLAIHGSDSAPMETAELLGYTAGIRADGCLAEGYRAVYESVPAGIQATTLAEKTLQEPTRMILNDPAFLKIETDWVTCMQDTPFKELRNPGEAYDHASRQPEISKEIAVADATCRAQVNYDEQLDQILNRYLTSFAHTIEEPMLDLQQIRARASTQAKAILSQ